MFHLLFLLFLYLFAIPPVQSQEHWQLLYQPRQRIVKTIGIYNEQIFIGTGNGISLSKDKGKTWTDFGSVPGGNGVRWSWGFR